MSGDVATLEGIAAAIGADVFQTHKAVEDLVLKGIVVRTRDGDGWKYKAAALLREPWEPNPARKKLDDALQAKIDSALDDIGGYRIIEGIAAETARPRKIAKLTRRAAQ
jgi:hypothetical protein